MRPLEPQTLGMKALTFDKSGSPLNVLDLRDLPMPRVKPGTALVQMLASSINPGDFLFVQSLYPEPKKPNFPAQIAGNHGVGVVVETDSGIAPGTRVAFSYFDAWSEYAVVPVEWLIPIPEDYPLEKAAQVVNLVTAWDLLEAARIQPGQWLALTGGNSMVAVLTLQFAQRLGARVIPIVRRDTPGLDLKALGASEVVNVSELTKTLPEHLDDLTGGEGLHAILDGVGGPLLGDLVRSAALGAQVVIYGGVSLENFSLHNFDILMRAIEVRAYIYRFFFEPPKPEYAETLRQIFAVSGDLSFVAPLGGMHDLKDYRAAIEKSLEGGGAKHFFHFA